MIGIDKLYLGDCLRKMTVIPDGCVDMVMTDPPYGMTQASWDAPPDLFLFWGHMNRIVRPDGAIVVTATQPFTTVLIMSNQKGFRHSWVWDKSKPGNVFQGKRGPMRVHEDVCVFGREPVRYYPIMEPREKARTSRNYGRSELFGLKDDTERVYTHRYPRTILQFSNANNHGKLHSTQKPVPLFEYLTRTYTEPGDLVLDPFMGSGTTAIACINSGRHWIGYEKDAKQWAGASRRIRQHRDSTLVHTDQ